MLTGRLAALNRFISRASEKCLPFFKMLRGNGNFGWTDECESAFQALKGYLSSAPLLSTPKEGETLYLYITASTMAVSDALMKDDIRVQHPIFYSSRILSDAEMRYTKFEKLTYALLVASQKLKQYFQAYEIVVLTDQPIRQILNSPDISG